MESANEASKLIAQARKLVLDYLDENNLDNEAMLVEAECLLEHAIEKLT